jgi:hypothetical protein
MSKLRILILSAGVASALAATGAHAQLVGRGATVTANPARVTAGRPTVAGPEQVRPHRGGHHLQQRLRYACFTSPNPPVQLCRRYFGHRGDARPGE